MENVADACGDAGSTAAGHVSGAAREEVGATSLNDSAADAGGNAK